MLEYIFLHLSVMSICASAAFLILMLLKPLTKRIFSARWNYFSLVLIMLIFLLPLSADLPQQESFTPKSTKASLQNGQNSDVAVMYVLPASDAKGSEHEIVEEEQSSLLSAIFDSAGLLSKIWLAVAALLIVLRISLYISFKTKINRASIPYPIDEACQIIAQIKKCSLIKSPVLMGLGSRVLYLPDRQFTKAELDSILRHEYVHLRRMDIPVKWLCLVVKSLHWFNPLVYLLCKKISLECEISCDVEATRNLDRDKVTDYCETILSLISDKDDKTSLSLGMGDTKKNLERRFRAIMTENNGGKKIAVISAILTGIIVLSALTASAIFGGKVEKNNDANKKEETKISENEYTDDKADLTEPDFNTVVVYKEIENENENNNVVLKVPDDDADKADNTEYTLIPLDEAEGVEIQVSPLSGAEISADFDSEKHPAVDYKLNEGTVVTSPFDGKIVTAEYSPDKGNHIEIQGLDGSSSVIFAHLSKMYVDKGDKVNAGDTVGTVGSTGRATGPHLHVEYYVDGEVQNPVEIFFTQEDGEILAVYSEPEYNASTPEQIID